MTFPTWHIDFLMSAQMVHRQPHKILNSLPFTLYTFRYLEHSIHTLRRVVNLKYICTENCKTLNHPICNFK